MKNTAQIAVDCRKHLDRSPRSNDHGESRPLRILHVVSRMQRAGIETWLMHVLRNIDRQRFHMDFLVHHEEPGHFDEEIRDLGSRLFFTAPLRQVWNYGKLVTRLLCSEPPYDIVHSHLDYFSGYPLKSADRAGVPVRIAHSHNDLALGFPRLRWSLKCYAQLSKSLISRHGTLGLATSSTAGESLFGNHCSKFPWRVLPCGIDLTAHAPEESRCDIRREFGIPEDFIVIGHVGRFAEQKNHRMVLRIAEALRRRTRKFHLFLVGDGLLRPQIEEVVNHLKLTPHVTFAGIRGDVPRLFTSLFDVFVFPSQFEGLGLVVVESQSAGCPAVISDVVPPEAEVVPRLVTRLPLSAPVEQWVDSILRSSRECRSHKARNSAFEAVARSPFNISVCVQDLTTLYLSESSNRNRKAA